MHEEHVLHNSAPGGFGEPEQVQAAVRRAGQQQRWLQRRRREGQRVDRRRHRAPPEGLRLRRLCLRRQNMTRRMGRIGVGLTRLMLVPMLCMSSTDLTWGAAGRHSRVMDLHRHNWGRLDDIVMSGTAPVRQPQRTWGRRCTRMTVPLVDAVANKVASALKVARLCGSRHKPYSSHLIACTVACAASSCASWSPHAVLGAATSARPAASLTGCHQTKLLPLLPAEAAATKATCGDQQTQLGSAHETVQEPSGVVRGCPSMRRHVTLSRQQPAALHMSLFVLKDPAGEHCAADCARRAVP